MTKPTKELVITRIFDAPRELVYQAFTDPDQLAQWFGPVGFTVPRDSVDTDVRTGGHQRMTMVSNGDPAVSAPVANVFVEIVENELIVAAEDETCLPETGMPLTTLRLEFYDEGGKTRLVLRQGPFPDEIESMAREGWSSSFTKLDDLLARR